MARQGIGTGSAPNDGTGDTLRAGAAKANDNFSELYNYLGDGNNLTAVIGSGIATAGGTVGTGATILDFRGTGISTVTVSSGIATINITGGGGSSYSDSDVDTHLNTSSASASEVLSWTGTDYDWVAQSGGSGITTADVRTNTLVVSGVSTLGVTSTTNLTSQQLNVSGIATVGTALSLAGGASLVMGTQSDESGNFIMYNDSNRFFEIFPGTSDKSISIRNNGSNAGDIRINSKDAVEIGGGGGGAGDYSIRASETGEAELYQQVGGVSGPSELRLTTTNSGVNVTGVCTATSFSGNGSDVSRQWTLGADGTSNYTFTGPGLTGAENDPTLYLTRGQQYQFVNNMGAHPFRIQSTPNGSTGTQYNDGITNNDVSSGTLTWDVQFDAPNILYYQCTSHPNMGGPIYIVPRSEPAVGVRTEVSGTTGSVGAAATTDLDITGFKSYGLLKVGISSAAWVRLYVDDASRTSDETRSYLVDPTPGSGLIAEVRTETAGISTFLMSPGVIGWNNDVSVGSTIYAAVTNNESSSATITVDLTVVKMED